MLDLQWQPAAMPTPATQVPPPDLMRALPGLAELQVRPADTHGQCVDGLCYLGPTR